MVARYCNPRSYISRTSRGTTSPNRGAGNWARAGAATIATRAVATRAVAQYRPTCRDRRPKPNPACSSRFRHRCSLAHGRIILASFLTFRGRRVGRGWPGGDIVFGDIALLLEHRLPPFRFRELRRQLGPLILAEDRFELGLGQPGYLKQHTEVILFAKPPGRPGLLHRAAPRAARCCSALKSQRLVPGRQHPLERRLVVLYAELLLDRLISRRLFLRQGVAKDLRRRVSRSPKRSWPLTRLEHT